MKTKRVLLAMTLALALCLSGLTTVAFAETGAITGSETSPVEVYFTKLFQLPEGTTVPTAQFDFLVTSKTVDGDDADADNMPHIGTATSATSGILTIKYKAGDEAGIGPDGENIVTIPKEYDIFDGITWPHAGEYVYSVSEVSGTYDIDDADLETMTYSLAEYTLKVYVKEGTGNDKGTYYIYAIGVIIDAEDNEDQTVGGKVDPTPGGGGSEFEYSQMTFTNTYVRTIGGGNPTNPADATLTISNKVEGEYSSSTIYFDYTLKLTVPSVLKDPPAYKAYVVQNGAIVTTKDNGAQPDGKGGFNDYIEFTSGTANNFSLKDGQKLVFVNTPVGTKYDIRQEGTTAYKASVAFTYNGKPDGSDSGNAFGDPVAVTGKLVGEAANSADFTNTRNNSVTPTGLDFGNLPFIGMIVLAIAAAAALIVAKARKKRYN